VWRIPESNQLPLACYAFSVLLLLFIYISKETCPYWYELMLLLRRLEEKIRLQ
jgi:hypothetical protein